MSDSLHDEMLDPRKTTHYEQELVPGWIVSQSEVGQQRRWRRLEGTDPLFGVSGYYDKCLRNWSVKTVAKWSSRRGFTALENVPIFVPTPRIEALCTIASDGPQRLPKPLITSNLAQQ